MLSAFLGKKVGMTQIFNDKGEAVPVTIIDVEDSIVMDKKTEEKHGYDALVVANTDVKKPKRVNKPIKGIFTKANLPLKKIIKEFKVDKAELDKYKPGDAITVEAFKDLKFVDVAGVSKGKGTQGVVKRWNFAGGPDSHGSMQHRAPGSIGSSTFPARVFKNQKMAGRMGNENVTVQNLEVVKVDTENKFMLVCGAVPGAKGGLLYIKKSVKKK